MMTFLLLALECEPIHRVKQTKVSACEVVSISYLFKEEWPESHCKSCIIQKATTPYAT